MRTQPVGRRTTVLTALAAVLVLVAAAGSLQTRQQQLTITGPAAAAAEEPPSPLTDNRGVRRGAADDVAAADEPVGDGIASGIEAPEVLGLPHVAPERVAIPSLEVESFLVDLGLNKDGSVQVPSSYDLAGWYENGPYPGDTNSPPALIVGHVDSARDGPAIFFRLKQIEIGATIEITREDGSIAVFEVVSAEQHPKDSLPTEAIYARRAPSELVLVTCTGQFNQEAGSYLDNFVVTARLDRAASLARTADAGNA